MNERSALLIYERLVRGAHQPESQSSIFRIFISLRVKKILQYNIVSLLLYCMSKHAVLCKICIYVLNRRLYNMFATSNFDFILKVNILKSSTAYNIFLTIITA